MDLRVVSTIILFHLCFALATLADETGEDTGLSERIEQIEYVHIHEPWPVSQRMIDALEEELSSATLSQRARIEIMEARNLVLDGQYQDALEKLDALLAQPISPNRRLRALELLVNVNYVIRDYERAFDLLGQALALFSASDDDMQKADVLTLAARLHSEVGEHELALESASESLALANRTEDPRTIQNSLYSLVLVERNAGHYAVAIERSRDLWQQAQQSEDPVSMASALGLIGSVHNAAGQHKKAIGWLKRAVDKNREVGYLAGELTAKTELGIALLKTDREQQGLELLAELIPELENRRRWPELMEIHEKVSDLHEEKGRYEAAKRHLMFYEEAWKRVRDDQRARRLAYMQVEFENRRRNQELQLLRQRNRLLAMREDTARAQRSRQILAVGMLLLVAVLLIGLLMRFRIDRRRFHRLSETDGLTGLYNHRFFHHEVERALAEARTSGQVCSLIAADVDLFKQVNDRYGHQAGDAVLRNLSALFLEQFPKPCIVGRVGGEEFAIFLPGHNRLQARQKISAFRERLGPVEFEGRSIAVTLSFGLVESRRETRLERLRTDADHALYRAKRSGRNQVVDAADIVNTY